MENMRRILLSIFFLLACVISAIAQVRDMSGTVVDSSGEPLIGVTVIVKNEPGLGVATDIDGKFHIKAKKYDILVFTFIGFERQEVAIADNTNIKVTMNESTEMLDEIVVTGAGVQRKATVTGAITTVDTKTLRTPTANLSNALVGNVAGIIGRQGSGEPGANYTEFWIRGISTFGASSSALVLVDGVERNFNEVNTEDIETFSVLKDASATAIYGQRGANGVVLITTKRGAAGKVNVNFKAEYGFVTRSRLPDFVDGVTYAKMANEARMSRYQDPLYSREEIAIIESGLDPDLYPNIDWRDRLLKDGTSNTRGTLNVSGGGNTARYFISAGYYTEDGMYKNSSYLNDYSTNSSFSKYNFRANVDVDLTKTTLLTLGVSGWMVDKTRPGHVSTDEFWTALNNITPLSVPILFSNGYVPVQSGWLNPETILSRTGYSNTWENKIESNITLDQKLDFIAKGLSFRGLFAYDSWNLNRVDRYKNPDVYRAEPDRTSNGDLVLWKVLDSEPLHQYTFSEGNVRYYLDANIMYDRLYDQKHRVSGLLKYYQQEFTRVHDDRKTDIIYTIPKRNMAVSGRATYGFMDRYLFEFNFGYTGSENFEKGERFGFFPAVSLGWVLSEEPFIKKHTSSWLDMFKVRYSYGEVGNDVMRKNNEDYRFAYLTLLSTGSAGYTWGEYGSNAHSGNNIERIGADHLTWEIAKKHNLGIDWNLFNSQITGTIDFFQDHREDIFMERNNIPYATGLEGLKPWANLGAMKSKGFDGNIAFHRKFGDFNATLRGNVTYAKNEVLEHDEAANSLYYQMSKGYRHNQTRGLIALGLFKDQDDIDRSPEQKFGGLAVMPGDIKYKDVNGDGIIDGDDIVPIGYTTTPNLAYGIGFSADWKGFDFNILFQGSGKSDFFVGGNSIYPFQGGSWGNILQDVANDKDRWIPREISGDPSTENPNALFPRLSYGENKNNYQKSTFWLRNRSYLRLKDLELGYTLPKKLTQNWHMENVRVFFLGYNLAVFSDFDWWDPEVDTTDGAKYPINKTYSLGLTVSF